MQSLIGSRRQRGANAPMIRSVGMAREKAGKRKRADPVNSEADVKRLSHATSLIIFYPIYKLNFDPRYLLRGEY